MATMDTINSCLRSTPVSRVIQSPFSDLPLSLTPLTTLSPYIPHPASFSVSRLGFTFA